jgi:TonB family protein
MAHIDILSRGLFKTLNFTESRKGFFGMSLAAHAVVLSILLVVPLVYTDTIKVKFDVVLTAPPLPKKRIVEPIHFEQVTREPVIQRKVLPPPPPKPSLVERPEVRPSEIPQISRLKQPEISEPAKPALDTAETSAAVMKMPEVRTGTFATESVPLQTSRPVQTVQTGGFGDQVGSKGAGRSARIPDVASLSSFDLPDAANARNGSERTFERAVHQGSFGDVDVRTRPESLKKRTELEAVATPVEIVFKPKPDYTDKARIEKVEGEVLLRVLFSATGKVRVLDIVRSLGYGLDENAVRAAQQIKFRPAQRDGQPVDSTATVHIVFQLAS